MMMTPNTEESAAEYDPEKPGLRTASSSSMHPETNNARRRPKSGVRPEEHLGPRAGANSSKKDILDQETSSKEYALRILKLLLYSLVLFLVLKEAARVAVQGLAKSRVWEKTSSTSHSYSKEHTFTPQQHKVKYEKMEDVERVLGVVEHFAILNAALELEVFDQIAQNTNNGPASLSARALASTTQTPPEGMEVLLDHLVDSDLLEKNAAQRYKLTTFAQKFLLRSSSSYIGGTVSPYFDNTGYNSSPPPSPTFLQRLYEWVILTFSSEQQPPEMYPNTMPEHYYPDTTSILPYVSKHAARKVLYMLSEQNPKYGRSKAQQDLSRKNGNPPSYPKPVGRVPPPKRSTNSAPPPIATRKGQQQEERSPSKDKRKGDYQQKRNEWSG